MHTTHSGQTNCIFHLFLDAVAFGAGGLSSSMAASIVMIATGVILLSATLWATAVIVLPAATIPMIAWIPTTMPPWYMEMIRIFKDSAPDETQSRTIELTCDGASWPKGKEDWRRDGRHHHAYYGTYNLRSHVCVKR